MEWLFLFWGEMAGIPGIHLLYSQNENDMEKKIYKTIIQVEILSEEPIDSSLSLSDIDYHITDGHCSGQLKTVSSNEEIVGKVAVEACREHGTSTEFFMMDGAGNEIDEDGEGDDYPNYDRN